MGEIRAVPKSRVASKWVGLILGLALLATIVGGVIAVRSKGDPKVVIGSNDEVYFYRRATEENARALGDALKSIGFFNGRGTSVLLWMGGGPTVVSFVVNEGAWEHSNAISNFTEIGRRITHSVGGFPIQVHLIDARRTIRKKMTVGKAVFGNDALYYFGDATESDAQALGHALQSAGYFAGGGFIVALLKGEGTVVSFVVQEGGWDQPDVVETLAGLVRQVAASVGGLPIRLRLLDREMGIKKEVEVR